MRSRAPGRQRAVAARRRRSARAGFSLVELLIAIAMTGAFAGALFGFFHSGTEATRGHENVARALAEARAAVAILAGDARQAVGTNPGQSPVLLSLAPHSVELLVDPNRSASAIQPLPKLVRYRLDGAELVREVAEPVGTPGAYSHPGGYVSREVLARRVGNGDAPLFTALTTSGAPLAATVPSGALRTVAAIRVRLVIVHRVGQADAANEVRTDVTLRNSPANAS